MHASLNRWCFYNIYLPTSSNQQNSWWVSAGAHDNVVRYHTAWFESDYCYIQTELCDGTLTQLRDADSTISLECSLLEIMRQVKPCHVFIPQILTLNDGLNIPKWDSYFQWIDLAQKHAILSKMFLK